MASSAAQKIIALLAPSIGDFLATAKVTAACNMSGKNVDTITDADFAEIAEQMELVCKSLGPEVARSIKEKVLAL